MLEAESCILLVSLPTTIQKIVFFHVICLHNGEHYRCIIHTFSIPRDSQRGVIFSAERQDLPFDGAWRDLCAVIRTALSFDYRNTCWTPVAESP